MKIIEKKKERLNLQLINLNMKAKRYGFKKEDDIKDYLKTRDYYSYLHTNAKLKGIEETQKFYLKFTEDIINKKFSEEIKRYKHIEIDNKLLLRYILKRMPKFKKEILTDLQNGN